MREETTHWGIEIVRTELKEIDPPQDVQETMNKVVKAENEKVAAIDFATATETMADGARRAEIKKAEGVKQAKILEAEGEAQAIQLVNRGGGQVFRRQRSAPAEVDRGRDVAGGELEDRGPGEHPAGQHRRRHGRTPAGEWGLPGRSGTAVDIAARPERVPGRSPGVSQRPERLGRGSLGRNR